MRSAWVALLIVSAYAQIVQPTPATVLNAARSRLLIDARRQTRYVCVQNIERQFFHPRFQPQESCSTIIGKYDARKREPPLTSWDRLRLDVTVANGGEIHSWPGTSSFNEEEIRKFVGGGPFGGGDFGPFISAVFGGAATVKFQGQRLVEGHELFEYAYEVGSRSSQYQVEARPEPVVTAYGGSFFLDPQTTDIVRLTVRTTELPESTGACQALSDVEYGRMSIHGRGILVPHETRLRLIDRNGKEAVGVTSYSSCHEYASKTVLQFNITEPNPGTASAQVAQPVKSRPSSVGFPKGLTFACRIVTPIDSDTAAAGSVIEAILRSPIRDKGVVLAPRGSRIRGRLVRLAEYKESLDYFEVGVRLESVEINGAEIPLNASVAHPATVPEHPVVTNAFEGIHDLQVHDSPGALPADVGVFFFTRAHLHLDSFDSEWVTVSPDAPVKSPGSEP